MKKGSSSFRFVPSGKPGHYSVHRGDEPFGYVTKVVHRITDRGMTRVFFSWTPSTLNRRDLATEKTREAAARVLWILHQTKM